MNTIKQWAKDDQPREKLLAIGPENLSHSELLAILIHNGVASRSAVDLAKDILKLGSNDLNELGKLTVKQLTSVKGIGEAKAITIAAALEIGRRRAASDITRKTLASNLPEIARFLREKLKDHPKEVFSVLYLNRSNKVLGFEIVSKGGITSTVVDPRVILKTALEKNAVGLILCHNHPSGNLEPSTADTHLTHKIKLAASYFEIQVLDHIIVSDEGYYSFANSGLL